MNCPTCGAPYEDGDLFCNSCGSQLPRFQPEPARVCARCGAPITPGNRFCEQCGAPVDGGAPVAGAPAPAPAPTPGVNPAPAPAPAPQPGTVPPAVPGAGVGAGAPGSGDAGTAVAKARKPLSIPAIAGIAAAVVVVVALIVFLVLRFAVPHDSGSPITTDGTSSSQDASGPSSKAKSAKPCTTAPSASVSSVSKASDGSTILATLAVKSGCDAGDFKEQDVRVTLTDDGATVADGVFDFTDEPVKASGSSQKITLAYPDSAYWRTPDDLSDDEDDLHVRFETGATANGSAAGVPSGAKAIAAAPVSDADANAAAQAAILHEIDEDRDDANGFMTTITTQLSSKRDGLDAEGRTWHYKDIYQQYLQTKAKYPNALLVDSSDWPTYRNTGTTGWYVILSGEGFPDSGSASSWCSAQGMSKDDCIPVDLQ